MSFLQILILICSLSFCGIAFLVSLRMYYFRALKREDLYRDLSLSKPFFYDFAIDKKINTGPVLKIFRLETRWGQSLRCRFEKIACRLKNKINGKHAVRCEKCDGYWGKFSKVKKPK